jgi:pyrroloquinoline quinone biosynthesis protein E
LTDLPLTLIAELSYKCPLHCPYCSNPLEIGSDHYRGELSTEEWARVLREARSLGVLQLGLTGGEPLVRKDLEQIVAVSRELGLYSTLVTSAIPLTLARLTSLRDCGLDHVQISIQDVDRENSDRLAGLTSFDRKLEAAAWVRELDLPLTMNVVLHRQNLDHISELLELCHQLGAGRVELANTQYYGWALENRAALLPTREQLARAEEAVEHFRARSDVTMGILYVIPDYYEDLPKPCVGGWASRMILIAPNGDVLPCHAASTIPSLSFENVRDRSLEQIWFESDSFNAFRGTAWMQEPCVSCPIGHQEVDFGGCRCQAFALTDDARAADPVCRFSEHRHLVTEAVEAAQELGSPAPLVYRTTRRRGAART